MSEVVLSSQFWSSLFTRWHPEDFRALMPPTYTYIFGTTDLACLYSALSRRCSGVHEQIWTWHSRYQPELEKYSQTSAINYGHYLHCRLSHVCFYWEYFSVFTPLFPTFLENQSSRLLFHSLLRAAGNKYPITTFSSKNYSKRLLFQCYIIFHKLLKLYCRHSIQGRVFIGNTKNISFRQF